MKYGNIYKVLIMAVLAAIILSLSIRLFKNPKESKEPIVQPETAAELTEEDIKILSLVSEITKNEIAKMLSRFAKNSK